ncbi:transporter substrate-binding domain-containing protein [Roseibium sp. SCP14]|uniref:transporter substrate-binding domain-containing protein n=1 Tax=Roseibium sp. SCP14 TaxID=3141375 RepID=UPI0033397F3C
MLRKLLGIAAVSFLSISAASISQAGETLDRIKNKGVLTVGTNSDWAPQAFLNSENEMDGFDVDVARAIAKRLGVDVTFVTPGWEVMTAGRWSGRWDIVVGSMTPTAKRAEVLDFPGVYYYTPAVFAVHNDFTGDKVTDLNDKTIGVTPSSTYHLYLQHELKIDAKGVPSFEYQVTPSEIRTYGAGLSEFDDLRLGNGKRLDGILQSLPTVLSAIEKGMPIRQLGEPVFYEPLAIAVDKGDDDFNLQIASVIEELREDGTFKALSEKWYGVDYTSTK